jgi:hypothetical protein
MRWFAIRYNDWMEVRAGLKPPSKLVSKLTWKRGNRVIKLKASHYRGGTVLGVVRYANYRWAKVAQPPIKDGSMIELSKRRKEILLKGKL